MPKKGTSGRDLFSPQKPAEKVQLGEFIVQGVHRSPFSTEFIMSTKNRIALLATIFLQLAFFLMAGLVLGAIKLQKQQDMNMKQFVRDYLVFWGLARFLRMMLAFTIEQRSREVTILHTLLFMILQLLNLAVISYFFIASMSMNEDLPTKDESAPSGKIIVLAVAPFYIIAVINFVEFLVRWFVLFWFVFVILEDYTESVEKDRTSILEMLMPGTKTKAFDQVMKERLS